MKQIFKIITLLLIITPLKSKALELNLNCPKEAYPNETINCVLTYENEITLNTLIIKYTLPKEITYQDLILNSNWESYYQSNKGTVLGSTTTTNNTITTLTLKISKNIETNKEYTISLTNIDASDKNFNSLTTEDITTTIKIIPTPSPTTESATQENNQPPTPTEEKEEILDNDSKLKSITLSYGKINFDPNTFEYKITVPNSVTNITIEAIPNSDKSTITIDKPIELIEGNNKITITVEAEDKTTSKYIIIINREIFPSNIETTPTNSKTLNIDLKYLIPIIIILLLIIIILIIKTINNKNK